MKSPGGFSVVYSVAFIFGFGTCGRDLGFEPTEEAHEWLAFVSRASGDDDIYLLDVTGAVRRIVDSAGEDRNPAWSADGRFLAYTADRTADLEVHVLDTANGAEINVSTHPGRDHQPVWSVTGQLAFVSDRDGEDEIYLVRPDGTGLSNLTMNAAPDQEPDWSPDGTRIAFSSGRTLRSEIYVVEVATGEVERISGSDEDNDFHPVWAPDGSALAFENDGTGVLQIHIVAMDARDVFVVVPGVGGQSVQPVWSPDSGRIAFLSDRGGNWEVYTVRADGSGPTNVTNASSSEARPIWSPSSSQIVYETNVAGDWDLWVVDADGGNPPPHHPGRGQRRLPRLAAQLGGFAGFDRGANSAVGRVLDLAPRGLLDSEESWIGGSSYG